MRVAEFYSLTRRTSNRKVSDHNPLDPVATVTISESTCPDSCPLKGAGCYGEGGPQALHWRKVSEGLRGQGLTETLRDLRALPARTKVRYAVTGDQPGKGDRIHKRNALRLAKALSHTRAWTYTHKPPVGRNLETIREINTHYAINLSADNLTEADEFKALGIAPVVVVLPSDATKDTFTPGGNRVKVCPATLPDSDVTCNTCMLCAVKDPDRVIVGFPAHGFRSNMMDKMIETGG